MPIHLNIFNSQTDSPALKFMAKSVVLLTVMSSAALAGDVESQTMSQNAPAQDWSFTLGGGVGYGPDYEGSNDYSTTPIPAVSASYRNFVFFEGTSLRVNALGFVDSDLGIIAGPTISYGAGRSHKDNKALAKMGDIKSGADLGGFLGYSLGPIVVGTTFTQELGKKRKGMFGDVSVGYNQVFTDQIMGSIGASATWADKDYMQDYFGVSAGQALATGYSLYKPKAGFKSVGLNLGLNYRLTEHFTIGASGGYSYLLDNAADSPLVRDQGSRNQFNGGLVLTYSF
jgi:MipA family protein